MATFYGRRDRPHVRQLPMVSAMKCPHCKDTGKTGASRYLDCAYCSAAAKRVKLNASVEALRAIGEADEDIWWNVWQASAEEVEASIEANSQEARSYLEQAKAAQIAADEFGTSFAQLKKLDDMARAIYKPVLASRTADLEAVRWAHNMLEGMGYGQSAIGGAMMERLQAMLQKV